MTEKQPWWERAVREHCEEHGPSGGAWNISMILDRLRSSAPLGERMREEIRERPKQGGEQ